MSTIKSDSADLTLNCDGASSSLKIQIDGVEKSSISSAGAFTSTTIDATKLTGNLPAISGASLTGVGVPGATGNASGLPTLQLDRTTTGATQFVSQNSNSNGAMFQFNNDSSIQINTRSSGTDTERLKIDSAGNMGLGVTPESWETGIVALQVGPTSNTFVDTGNSVNRTYNAYSDGSWRYQTASYATNFAHTATGTFMFRTAPSGSADAAISWTTAMTIGNAGQVDFSPFSPSGATEGLNINEVGKIITSANSTASRSRFGFYNPNGNVGNIATSGSSTSYSTSSDYRLKENLVPLTDSIERVKALKPYRFNFLADPDTTVDGFVAHEAGEVVPEAVSGEKDAMRMEEYEITPAVLDDDGNEIEPAVMGEREVIDPQGIDQAKLVPLMCSAIQQLITMNEDLTARVEALEA